MSGLEITIIIAAAAAASFIKSTSGTGYPITLIPALALFIDVHDSVVIVAPSNFILNGALLWQLRQHGWGSESLRRFLLASVPGAVIGSLLLPILPDRALRLLLVGLIFVFVLNRYRSAGLEISGGAESRLAPAAGGVAGFFQGATGISGPIVTPWFLTQNLSRDVFIHSVSMTYALSGLAQIATIGAQGEFTDDLLTTGLFLVPVAMAIMPLGVRVRERLSQTVFERVVVGTLIASAVSLVVRMF